jgi:hypothetical protein
VGSNGSSPSYRQRELGRRREADAGGRGVRPDEGGRAITPHPCSLMWRIAGKGRIECLCRHQVKIHRVDPHSRLANFETLTWIFSKTSGANLRIFWANPVNFSPSSSRGRHCQNSVKMTSVAPGPCPGASRVATARAPPRRRWCRTSRPGPPSAPAGADTHPLCSSYANVEFLNADV